MVIYQNNSQTLIYRCTLQNRGGLSARNAKSTRSTRCLSTKPARLPLQLKEKEDMTPNKKDMEGRQNPF